MLTYRSAHIIVKILFSTVLLQLFLIILALEHCSESFDVMAALEHSAMSAILTLGAGVLMEYVLKNNT